MLKVINKILMYLLPIIAYYYAIIHISNNTIILLATYISIIMVILYTIIDYIRIIIFKKTNLFSEGVYKFFSVIINIAFFYSIFEYSMYAGLLIIWMILSILLHEAGHFYFAVKNWVAISKFSVWFWQPILEFNYKWIKWRFSNLLFGWYVEFKDEEVLKDIKWKKHFGEIKQIIKDKWLKVNQLYIFKKLNQKLPILFWWVFMNLLIAYFSLIWFFIYEVNQNTIIHKQGYHHQLTKQQKQYIIKQEKEQKKDKDLMNYLKQKVWKTIWLWTKKINNKDEIWLSAWLEVVKWIEVTYYSLIYAINHPEYFTKFQSVVWVWKTVAKQDKIGFMNWGILLLIISIINISLFVINLLPIPAVDWWQVVKEIITHSLILWKKKPQWYISYIKIALSWFINILEYSWFWIITLYGLFLVYKDIFIN